MVAFDEPAALEALPHLLPRPADRREAMRIIDEIIALQPGAEATGQALI